MKLPAKVTKGQAVRADDFNSLIDFCQSLVIGPGPGYRRSRSMAGTTLAIDRGRGFWMPEGDYAPFAIREIRREVNNWIVRMEPGRVIWLDSGAGASGGNGARVWVPEIEETAVAMDVLGEDGLLAEITLPVSGYLYCQIRRTAEGLVDAAPKVVAKAAEETVSAHYQPPSPGDSGLEEVFQMRRLCQIEEDVDGNAVVRYFQKSDIELCQNLQTGENVGLGADVFKEWDETSQRLVFYRVRGCYGIASANETDDVELEFEGENVGTGEPNYKASVYKEKELADDCASKAKFRTLAQGYDADRKQIEIVETDESIRIQGNGINGTLVFHDCSAAEVGRVEWEDGLVTTAGDQIMTLGDCAPSSGGGG